MYLPRHYKQDKKKSTNYPLILFFILAIVLIGSVIYKWKDLVTYFSGNNGQKINKLEEQILVSLNKKTFPKNSINEYKSISNLYFEKAPIDATANYYIAKSYFYQVLDRVKFDITQLLELTSFERRNSYISYFQAEEDLEQMYRTALRANAFNSNFPEAESNKVLIYLFELIANRKKSLILLGELSLVDPTKLSKDLEVPFLWMNLVSSVLAGNIESLENFLIQNENLGDRKIDIQPRTVSYLKGVALYHSNDYIKALNFFREAKLGYDLITIEATKFEALIFFKQNLHEKSIALLENLYEETGSQDKKIIRLVKKILESKPNLKTKLKIAE